MTVGLQPAGSWLGTALQRGGDQDELFGRFPAEQAIDCHPRVPGEPAAQPGPAGRWHRCAVDERIRGGRAAQHPVHADRVAAATDADEDPAVVGPRDTQSRYVHAAAVQDRHGPPAPTQVHADDRGGPADDREEQPAGQP